LRGLRTDPRSRSAWAGAANDAMKKVAIIGGGSFGTTLAIALSRSRREHAISLWVHDPRLAEELSITRENSVYLPEFRLPELVSVTHDMRGALEGAEIVLGVMPSAHARELYSAMRPMLENGAAIVSATKGLELNSSLRMSKVIRETCGEELAARTAVLSGPSFAREVARGDPTAVVIASEDEALAAMIQDEFSGATLRLYTNCDVVGVELCGALKNVIAIAAGVCAGLEFGANTVAGLITRGLAEISRLACALGAKRETIGGLAGVGDLVLTCTGVLSRNRYVGYELGKGRSLPEILSSMRMVAEGVATTSTARDLARRAGIEMPITEQMYAVLYESRPPRDAIRELMERRLKRE
jgi:glycerol-3-phosphate dehydrogenase (NAD(P)+)